MRLYANTLFDKKCGGNKMKKYCDKCQKEYEPKLTKCPDCGSKLKVKYTKEEMREIQKQNDDFTVINTLLM